MSKLNIKRVIYNLPLLGRIVSWLYCRIISPLSFKDSQHYWENRYKSGGSSGKGSYNELAKFKAQVLNKFVRDKEIRTVVEFGCGDGNQLSFAEYPSYCGYDASLSAVKLCTDKFRGDDHKIFRHLSEYFEEHYDLALSLDVIYHLVEDEVYGSHMNQIFSSANKYVIIYSTNTDNQLAVQAAHVRHRRFTEYTDQLKNWVQVDFVKNEYPVNSDFKNSSSADFYVFKKIREI